jgi:hypothetical protein
LEESTELIKDSQNMVSILSRNELFADGQLIVADSQQKLKEKPLYEERANAGEC